MELSFKTESSKGPNPTSYVRVLEEDDSLIEASALSWKLLLSLSLIFLASFSVPLILGIKARSVLTTSEKDNEREVDATFPNSIVIRGAGSYLRVPSNPKLNPIAGNDFLVSVWVKITQPVNSKDREIVFLKYDSEEKNRSGYGLALSSTGEKIRPEVYWKDKEGKGGWYTFSDLPIELDQWWLLCMSYRQDQYLGLHAANITKDDKVDLKLLGGYQVEEVGIPESKSELQIGAPQHSEFRGKIGPVFVLNDKGVGSDLSATYKSFAKNPLDVPSSVSRSSVVLQIIDGKQDISKYENKVVPVRVRVGKTS